jgi:hypothetical protein
LAGKHSVFFINTIHIFYHICKSTTTGGSNTNTDANARPTPCQARQFWFGKF